MSGSYRDFLKARITELHLKIQADNQEKEELTKRLHELEILEFEEELREENDQILLNENQGRLF